MILSMFTNIYLFHLFFVVQVLEDILKLLIYYLTIKLMVAQILTAE